MHLKRLELNGFKSFAKKSEFVFDVPIIAIVGPNGSGKSNVVEAIRFVLGEQSTKSMRAKSGSDLIFKGSKQIPKMSRASVTIVFDNKKRVFHLHNQQNEKLNIDFDEIHISREVYSDGTNSYRINGHDVRMKDIHELIASVNIGSSGHHIISQGEADRYLNANTADRRALVEEALGLKVFQYRLKESLRKLKKAEENMRESELLRRELAPHLRFLKKQVEKLEKAKHFRIDLREKYERYFLQEDAFIAKLHESHRTEEKLLDESYANLDEANLEGQEKEIYPEVEERNTYIQKEAQAAKELLALKQDLGRFEGMISLLQEQTGESQGSKRQNFSLRQLEELFDRILKKINSLEDFSFAKVSHVLTQALESFTEEKKELPLDTGKLDELLLQKEKTLKEIHDLEEKQGNFQDRVKTLSDILTQKELNFQERQKSYYEMMAQKKELDGRRALLVQAKQVLEERIRAREEEYREAKTLLGDFSLKRVELEELVTPQEQEQLRREIERIKIRLEDIGGGSGADVIQEYEETQERDQFLEKEIHDLEDTILSLQKIIDDLKDTLNHQFDEGIEKINEAFGRFFRMMFGGGQARLSSVVLQKRKRKDDDLLDTEEDERVEYGLDIKVQLPRKKVSDLEMLSGGERSLTSIALLFALSQVNPPPFLVLDETDAALDEANSQRYGDMVASLSKLSQLLVVTHNRETMSRAQTLFGVTLGSDDASTVLSLRLEDAAAYAK